MGAAFPERELSVSCPPIELSSVALAFRQIFRRHGSRRFSGAMASSSAGAHCWWCGAQSFHGDYEEASECAASRRGFSQANYAEYVRFKCCGCKCSIECLDAISELKATRMPAGAKVHDPCGIQLLFDVRPWTLASDDPALEEVKEWWTPANPSTRQPAEMKTGPCCEHGLLPSPVLPLHRIPEP